MLSKKSLSNSLELFAWTWRIFRKSGIADFDDPSLKCSRWNKLSDNLVLRILSGIKLYVPCLKINFLRRKLRETTVFKTSKKIIESFQNRNEKKN